MRTLDKTRQIVLPAMYAKDIEMARVAQRCIMEALDHSPAAAITLATDSGEHPTVEGPPAALDGVGAQSEHLGRQGSVGGHHQTRRRLPAHPAHSGRQVCGSDRPQAQRSHQPVAGATQGPCGLAKNGAAAERFVTGAEVKPSTSPSLEMQSVSISSSHALRRREDSSTFKARRDKTR